MSESWPTFADPVLRRYLLGELGDTERDAVEDAIFADDATFARLEAIEDELLDEIARGELVAPTFAASRRERLAAARALAPLADRRLAARRAPRRARWAPILAAAAMLVVAAGLSVTLLGHTRAIVDLTVERGAGGPPLVAIGRFARTLELDLVLPGEVEPAGLEARLVGPGGDVAWAGPVPPDARLSLPAADLPAGLYDLELRGGEPSALVASRQIEIRR